jgi:hypothetical protein
LGIARWPLGIISQHPHEVTRFIRDTKLVPISFAEVFPPNDERPAVLLVDGELLSEVRETSINLPPSDFESRERRSISVTRRRRRRTLEPPKGVNNPNGRMGKRRCERCRQFRQKVYHCLLLVNFSANTMISNCPVIYARNADCRAQRRTKCGVPRNKT